MSLLTNSQLHHLKTTLFNYWIAFVDIKLCLFGMKNMYIYIYDNGQLDKWPCLLLLAAGPWADAVQQAVGAGQQSCSKQHPMFTK